MPIVGRLKAALYSDTAKSLGVLLLKSPALLLADVWYRGVADDNVYGWLVRRLVDAGLCDESWPVSPVDYIKPGILMMSITFIGGSVPQVSDVYKSISVVLLRQLSFALCQRYLDDSYGRVVNEEDSLSGLCEISSHPFLTDDQASSNTLVCLPDEQPSPPPGFLTGLAVGVLHLVALLIIASLINWLMNSSKLLNGASGSFGLIQLLRLLTVILCIIGVPGWITRKVNVVVCIVDVLDPLITNYILSAVLWIAWTISLMVYVTQLTVENHSKLFVSWIVLCAVQAAVRWQLDDDLDAGDFLLNLLADTTSSPFGFIGLCAAVAFFSKAVCRVVYAWLNGTIARPQLDATGGCVAESEGFLAAGFLLYVSGLSSSPLVLITGVIASTLTMHILGLAEPVLLSPERGHRWTQLRAMTIYIIVVAFPVYSTYRVYTEYGLASWEFVFVAPAMVTSLSAVGSLVKRVVYAIDDWTTSGQFEDIDEVVGRIRTTTLVANGIIDVCILCLTVAMVFVSSCKLWALMNAAMQCEFNFRRPYIAFREANARRRRIAELIASMPAPSGEDRRLDDVCPICFVNMVISRAPVGDLVQPVTACVLTPCGHVYHRRCLTKWMSVGTVCPTCRTDLSMENRDQRHTTPEYVAALMWVCLLKSKQLVKNVIDALKNGQRNNDVAAVSS